MARNEEKAQSLLNRWTSMKEERNVIERRPFLASDCDNLPDAERWRRQVLREITRKVAEIQNAGLGEHLIRDLNDQINKLLREKGHWERRIRELGGPDYGRAAPKSYDADGRELMGDGGYKYFGAAKNLPGVRELFEQQPPEQPRRTRAEIFKGITPDYYGYRDEDDGILVQVEAKAERRRIREAVTDFYAQKRRKLLERAKAQEDGAEVVTLEGDSDSSDDGEDVAAAVPSESSSVAFRSHIVVPAQVEFEKLIMERKKKRLMEKFMEEVQPQTETDQ